jgi:hypothetical protein
VREIKAGLKTLWKKRAWLSLTDMTEPMRDSWLRARETPLRPKADYLPQFAYA